MKNKILSFILSICFVALFMAPGPPGGPPPGPDTDLLVKSITFADGITLSYSGTTLSLDDGDGLPITLDDVRLATSGGDAAAIHDDTAAEIAVITAKATPVDGDFLLLEDSAAANAKKSLTMTALWTNYIYAKITATIGAAYDTEAELAALFSGKQSTLTNEAGLYAALSDVTQFYEVGDTVAEADIHADIARDAEMALLYQPLEATLTDIADGTITENLVNTANPWAVNEGGTGANTEANARTALGLAIGTNVQAYDADLDDLADGSLSGSKIGINGTTLETSIAVGDLILVYDVSIGANRAMTKGNFVTGIGAGQAIILDIGDDGGDDSVDVGEIATTGDTNSVITMPAADKLLIDFTKDWPKADSADTLSTVLTHELGGLEANVSAYSGLVKITGGTTSAVTTTAFAESILDDADEATFKATVNLEIGTDVQAYDADLATYAGITPSANIQTFLGAADFATARTSLDVYSTSGAAAVFEAIDAEIVRADTADTISADWEWQDNISQSFGNDNDWEVYYNESGTDTLTFITAGTAAAAASDPMILFSVDSGAVGIESGQEIFEIQSGATPLFTVTSDGNLTITGTLTAGSIAGGTTAWDTIGDPSAAGTVAFSTHAQTITSAIDVASGYGLTIQHTEAAIANDIYLQRWLHTSNADEDSHFWLAADASGTKARLDYDGTMYAKSFNAFRTSSHQFTDFYEGNGEAGDNYHRLTAQAYSGTRTSTLPDYNIGFPNTSLVTATGTLAANQVDSDNYVDASIDLEHLSAGAKFQSLAVADLGDTATPSVLTVAETTNKVISNYKVSGADHVFTMPAAHVAGNVIFPIGDEFQIDIEPDSGANFYLNGTAMAADEHIQNTADTLGQRIVGYVVNINGTLTWMFYSSDTDFVEETPPA